MAAKPKKQELAPAIKRPRGGVEIYDRHDVLAKVAPIIASGMSLVGALAEAAKIYGLSMPSHSRFMEWVEEDPEGFGATYDRARALSYKKMADEILDLTDQTHLMVDVHSRTKEGVLLYKEDGSPQLMKVVAQLSPDVIAHRRLQIDTRKWLLSKVLPKLYGDKMTTELTGKDGGPIQIAATDMRKLTDAELKQMEALASKAST